MGNPYNNLKVFYHTEQLEAIRNGQRRAPVYVRLKPTNVCNHHCAYCTYGSGETNNKTDNRDSIDHRNSIPWSKMKEIIEDMGIMGVKALTLSGGGEPLTYSNILDTLKLIKENHIELSLISNGQLLEGDVAKEFYHAKWVRISFDSPIENTYCRLRGVRPQEFKRVLSNIEDFAKNKDKDCVLGVNFVISRENSNSVYEAARLLKDLGVDNVKFAAVIENIPNYHFPIKDDVIYQIKRAKKELESDDFRIINNYESDWEDKQFSEVSTKKCYTCYMVTVIAADQKVYLCHTRAYDSGGIVGDLREKSFRELWFSDKTTKRLSELVPARDCHNFCVYEERNRVIQSYMDANIHVNFI